MNSHEVTPVALPLATAQAAEWPLISLLRPAYWKGYLKLFLVLSHCAVSGDVGAGEDQLPSAQAGNRIK
jgi:hypothetical protein